MINNKVFIEKCPRTKIFLEMVNRFFSFLKDYEYQFKEIKLETDYVLEDIVEVLYENKNLNRLIVIHYEPNDSYGNKIDFISLSLFKDRILQTKELVFKKYLYKYRPDIQIEHLSYLRINNKATFEDNMRISISGFSYFLSDIGVNLLNGSEWEDGLIYDWFCINDIFNISPKECLYIKDSRA